MSLQISEEKTKKTPGNITQKRVDPKVIIFACRYCPLIGAEEAGRQKIQMPENFRVIPVECAARVEPDAVIRAFSLGIDGVAVLACHLDGCRYNNANHRSAKQMRLLATLLDTAGIDSRRLLTSYGTAHEAHQFAGLIQNFVNLLEKLPPLKSKGPDRTTDQTIEPDAGNGASHAHGQPVKSGQSGQ